MQLVELFLQGVKGFPTQARIALSPGLVVLEPAGSGLKRVLEALVYLDDPTAGELDLDDAGAAASRLALTFRTRDGAGWRLVRDLRGGCALQRLDDSTGRFTTMASQAGEIGPYLRSQTGLPGRSTFLELLTLGTSDFPSASPRGVPVSGDLSLSSPGRTVQSLPRPTLDSLSGLGQASAAGYGALPPAGLPVPSPAGLGAPSAGLASPSPSGFGSQSPAGLASPSGFASPPPAGFGAAEPAVPAPERLRALEEELAASREIEALEARLDQVRGRLHELDDRFKAVPAAETELAAAREASRDFTASIPDEMADEVARYHGSAEKRDAALARIVEEQERLSERAARPIATAPGRDWRFLASAGLGAAVLLTASITAWKHLALLGIPAFGVAAAFGLVFVGDLQRRDSLGRRRSHLAVREKKVHEQWQAETMTVRRAMATIGVERAADLEAWIAARADNRRRVAAAEEALRSAAEDPRFAEAKARLEALQAEAAQVEDTLASKGAGAWRSSAEIAREIERLSNPEPHDGGSVGAGAFGGIDPRAAAGAFAFGAGETAGDGGPGAFGDDDASAAAGRAVFGGSTPGPSGALAAGPSPLRAGAFPSVPREAIEDPSARLLDRAAELLAESRIALFATLAPRASAYLAALTRKRLVSFSWTDEGGVRCAGGDEEFAFQRLPPGDRDLAWLALRLAVMERHQAKAPLPLILDEPFANLPAELHPLLAKMVRGLGARGQVIHCTRLPAMAADPS